MLHDLLAALRNPISFQNLYLRCVFLCCVASPLVISCYRQVVKHFSTLSETDKQLGILLARSLFQFVHILYTRTQKYHIRPSRRHK